MRNTTGHHPIQATKSYTLHELCSQLQLDENLVTHFVEREWIRPVELTGQRFDDQDLSRSQLILELKNDFDVNDEGIDVILHLLDQVMSMRRLMRS